MQERLTESAEGGTIEKGSIFVGPVVSPEELRALVERVLESKAEADECDLVELLRTECVDAFVEQSSLPAFPVFGFFKEFFEVGNATRAAARYSMSVDESLELSDRTACNWLKKFCEFASGFLEKRAAREQDRKNAMRDFQVRWLQCKQQCGDRRNAPAVSGMGGQLTSGQKTKKLQAESLGGCSTCPLH